MAFYSSPRFCLQCESSGPPRAYTPDSIFIEVILWLCFIVPGVIYSLWRHSRRHDVCRSCGSPKLVPVDSPAALRVARGEPRHLVEKPAARAAVDPALLAKVEGFRKAQNTATKYAVMGFAGLMLVALLPLLVTGCPAN